MKVGMKKRDRTEGRKKKKKRGRKKRKKRSKRGRKEKRKRGRKEKRKSGYSCVSARVGIIVGAYVLLHECE